AVMILVIGVESAAKRSHTNESKESRRRIRDRAPLCSVANRFIGLRVVAFDADAATTRVDQRQTILRAEPVAGIHQSARAVLEVHQSMHFLWRDDARRSLKEEPIDCRKQRRIHAEAEREREENRRSESRRTPQSAQRV